MNVAGYTRVSTDGQVGEDKYGLESQKQEIEKYCAAHDMNIIAWYSDEGESGAKWRKGFDSIVFGDVMNPPIEAVIVAKSDRVARDINVYFSYKGLLMRKDIQLISVSEDFGAYGAYAPILEAFTAVMAKIERDNINKRMSGGRKVKALKGGYSGGQPPMGYKVVDGELVIDEDEAKTVRFIFERKAAGASMLSTVDALNDAGYKTRKGKKFVISTVQSIWHNEKTYRGWYKYGPEGEWVKGQHEPILTDNDEA